MRQQNLNPIFAHSKSRFGAFGHFGQKSCTKLKNLKTFFVFKFSVFIFALGKGAICFFYEVRDYEARRYII